MNNHSGLPPVISAGSLESKELIVAMGFSLKSEKQILATGFSPWNKREKQQLALAKK